MCGGISLIILNHQIFENITRFLCHQLEANMTAKNHKNAIKKKKLACWLIQQPEDSVGVWLCIGTL